MSLKINGGSVFDGLSDCFVKNTSIIISNRKIVGFGSTASTEKQINAEGAFILPGLINAHVHLIWDAGPDPELKIINKPDSFTSLIAYNEACKHLRIGITTVRDTGSCGESVLSLRDAINLGVVDGPNIVASGPPIAMTGGHIHRVAIEVNGADQVRAAARENLKKRVDFIKLMATGGVYTEGEEPGSPQLTEEEMKAAVEEAHKRGKKATAHAEGLEGIINALNAGVDCIEHGNYADSNAIEVMVNKSVFLIPTIVCFIRMAGENAANPGVPCYVLRKAKEVMLAQKDSFRNAVRAGVKIVTGTDSGAPLNPPSDYYTELELMSEGGMSNLDVLKASTSLAAEAISMSNVGTIEINKLADILIVEENPLFDLNNLKKIRYVIKSGKVVINNCAK